MSESGLRDMAGGVWRAPSSPRAHNGQIKAPHDAAAVQCAHYDGAPVQGDFALRSVTLGEALAAVTPVILAALCLPSHAVADTVPAAALDRAWSSMT